MTYQEIIAYLVSATADLRLSGGLLELDNASVRLPDELRVEVSKSGEQVDVEFSPPLRAEKSLGLCNVAVRVPSIFITHNAVVARTRLGNVRICAVPHEPIVFGARPRHPDWEKFRADFKAEFPTCAACGETEFWELHHIEAFHKRPDLELVEENVIPLCGSPVRACHYLHGHGGVSWSVNNPHVVEDAVRALARRNEIKALLEAA